MTSVVHVNDIAQEYRRTGDLYRAKADEEFHRGDLLQASEKAWGAVSQHLKASAEERGWAHRKPYVKDRPFFRTGESVP